MKPGLAKLVEFHLSKILRENQVPDVTSLNNQELIPQKTGILLNLFI